MALDALRHGLSALRRGAGVTALTAALLLGASAGAHADPDWDTGVDDGGAEVGGSQPGTGGDPGSGGGGGGGSITVPGPWTQRIYVPACDINSVTATGPGIDDYETVNDVLCMRFGESCPAEDENRFIVFERRIGANGRALEDGFRNEGTVCRGPNEPDESQPPTISVAEIVDRARALAPTPTFVIEPAGATYVNIPTNFAAQAEAVTVNVTVLGFTIPVEFTPGDVTWRFGDGGTGSGLGVRNADVGQAGAVEHSYARSGEYDVSLSVAYAVRINLPGGPLEIPTPITRTAAPQALEVGEIQSVVTEVD